MYSLIKFLSQKVFLVIFPGSFNPLDTNTNITNDIQSFVLFIGIFDHCLQLDQYLFIQTNKLNKKQFIKEVNKKIQITEPNY